MAHRASLLSAVVLLSLCASTGHAQKQQQKSLAPVQVGRLQGLVVDAASQPVADAVVTARSLVDGPNGGVKKTVQTSDSGTFVIGGLDSGTYRIDVVHVGYVSSNAVVVVQTLAGGPILQAAAGEHLFFVLVKTPASAYFGISEPNYFISGPTKSSGLRTGEYGNEVKFRVALQYELLSFRHTLYESGAYAAYTQNSWWNLYENSAPFLDNNYNPRFYLYADHNDFPRHLRSLPSMKLGVEHESNGRDSTASRSWNRVYFGVDWGDATVDPVYGRIKAWVPFAIDDNPDIQNYLGRAEVAAYWQPHVRSQRGLGSFGVGLKSRVLGSRTITNEEVDVFWGPLSTNAPDNARGHWHPSFIAQLFEGTGENLLLYRTRRAVLRLGLATVR